MSKYVSSGRSRLALQFFAAGAVAALLSGCSTDSTRLSDPFSNPFTTSSNEPERSASPVSHTIPAGRSSSVVSQNLPPRSNAVASAAPLRPRLTASNAPISRETTGSIEPGSARSSGGWSSTGGVPVTVADGDTAEVLSTRYGVPTAALLQTNGLRNSGDIHPGSSLIIPVYSAAGSARASQHLSDAAPRPARPLAKAALLKPANQRAASAQTRQHGMAVAQAKPVAGRLVAPAKTALVQPKGHPADTLAARPLSTKTTTAARDPATDKSASPKPKGAQIKTAMLAPAAPAKQPDAAPIASQAPAQPVADASGNPEFRWPARGHIIQGFKPGSGGNDGINIAVPEGTAVKAAEGGTVAYAGSELKGYGNLVLIRHPNGFVTAYANNGELDVKRGEQVKRGQTIAKSGQTGNVSSPQLHFELRKGSTPVDPTSYLAGL